MVGPYGVALYTARQNIVAVITNGTAVLGLGDIGALAAKPVMEGKAVGMLFVATCTFLIVPEHVNNLEHLNNSCRLPPPTMSD